MTKRFLYCPDCDEEFETDHAWIHHAIDIHGVPRPKNRTREEGGGSP